jgi:hypothetical protein
VEWLVRRVRVHSLRSCEHLFPAEPKLESCLTHLAVHEFVAAATQNRAMHALVCLDTRVLTHALEGDIRAVRADKKSDVPVVLTHAAVAAVILLMDGTAQPVANRLDGSGWRIMAAVRIRVKGIDVQIKPLTVRSGKGDQDRFTTVPATRTPWLPNHLAGLKTWPQQDSAPGQGDISLPQALAWKAPQAAKAWGRAVCLPRPEPLRRPAGRHHPSPSR